MADEKKTGAESEEETVDGTEETEEEAEEANDTEEESEESSNDLDLDAELEAERGRKPDPEKAKKAFKDREAKRKQEEEAEEEDEDAPITRRDLSKVREEVRKEVQGEQALEIARGFAKSEKEAELIVLKWQNRSFPGNLTLRQQVEEAYAITHAKRLVSTNRELVRTMKGKALARPGGSGGHPEAPKGGTPKVPADLKASLARAGFTFDSKERRWKKKLPNGKYLVKDTASSAPRLLA